MCLVAAQELLKRQADLKYKITSNKINEYKNIQAGLLENYAPIVKRVGKLFMQLAASYRKKIIYKLTLSYKTS